MNLKTQKGGIAINNAILSEGTEALGIGIRSSDGYIAFNKMEGVSVNPAIMVAPREPLKGNKNVVMDNDLSKFKALTADVLFDKDTCDNVFIGPKCKISDLGSNNSIQMNK